MNARVKTRLDRLESEHGAVADVRLTAAQRAAMHRVFIAEFHWLAASDDPADQADATGELGDAGRALIDLDARRGGMEPDAFLQTEEGSCPSSWCNLACVTKWPWIRRLRR